MVSSMIRAGLVFHFALFATALVIPRVPAGTQFITGPCTSDGDCASGCCNAKTALCAARLVALEGAGCGFGSSSAGVGAAAPAAATDAAASAPAATVAAAAPAGTQFITGACTSDADCASGCCNAKTALCAARLVALEGAGCGFGSSSAGIGAAAPAVSTPAAAPAATVAAASPPAATIAAAAPTGTQFITGACASDADCASGCCNAKTALCAARLVALEGAGCGFGSSSVGVGAAAPAVSTPAAVPAATVAAATTIAASTIAAAAPAGTQFITGVCASDADCASGCCNAKTAQCAARLVALEGAGCGFGSASAGVGAAASAAATPAAAPAPAAPADGAPAKAPGTQFITGACTSDADCASGCCGKKSGLCAARAVALETAGCGFGA
ncbi:hypothetical protein B0H17DRAFT_1223162 [Mycena rosella]|uniref:Biotrophy-associated secreted protein 2 n=1 Tax=Mycena rosella TaxID=1033263 RepID=A0AAD7F823_MYCRO|nr:hypothetical protein B0H17DRAFT_1223162 [Mycena rosella]